MFRFCFDCTNEYLNSSSWITPLIQFISALIAFVALRVAWINLKGLRRTQSLQAQMSLINLENEVRRAYQSLKVVNQKYASATGKEGKEADIKMLAIEKTNAFEMYVSTADKLAALINSEYLQGQFEGRNWRQEYNEVFSQVKQLHEGDDSLIPGKSKMICNINMLLDTWQKEVGANS